MKDSVACGASRDLRLGHPPGLRAALRRDGDRPDPARRRRDRVHHEHGRPRLLGRRRVELVRADPQPVRSRRSARLVERLRGSPLVRRDRPGRGLRPGRLDPCARLVVRLVGSSRPTRWSVHGITASTRRSTLRSWPDDGGATLMLQAIAGLDPGGPRRATCRGRLRGAISARRRSQCLRIGVVEEGFSETSAPSRDLRCGPRGGRAARRPGRRRAGGRSPSPSRRAASRSPASSRA